MSGGNKIKRVTNVSDRGESFTQENQNNEHTTQNQYKRIPENDMHQ